MTKANGINIDADTAVDPCEQLDAFVVQSSRRVVERHFSDTFEQHVSLPCLHRNVVESRKRSKGHATDQRPMVQRYGLTHGCDRRHKRRFEAKKNTHQRKSYCRHDGSTARRPVFSRSISSQRCRHECTTRAEQRRLRTHGWRCQCRFQSIHRRSRAVCEKSETEPGSADGIKALEKATAKYPLRRVDCMVFSIPRGSMSHTHENVYLDVLPKRVVLCCIDNDAYNGAYAKNPFNAKHNNMNFMALYVDGHRFRQNRCNPVSTTDATSEVTSICWLERGRCFKTKATT